MAEKSSFKQDMDNFRLAVGKLGNTVNKSGMDWNDAQFSELKEIVRQIASASKQVITVGEKSESALQYFRRAESE